MTLLTFSQPLEWPPSRSSLQTYPHLGQGHCSSNKGHPISEVKKINSMMSVNEITLKLNN